MPNCVICAATGPLVSVALAPGDDVASCCAECAAALDGDVTPGPRWRCLADAIWSDDTATQIAAWRLLRALPDEGWAVDLLETVYLAPDVQERAAAGQGADTGKVIHRDSNGAALAQGDTVTLIKDLPVKGTSIVAKRGTAVRGIRLVPDNAEHIEGRVDGQQIIILCKFVKKSA